MKNPPIRRFPTLATATLFVCLISCVNIPTERVNLRYWPATGEPGFVYPERRNPEVWQDLLKKDDLGVCFSGGGTRASTAAAGQLRGLKEIGILPRVRYICGVSGGAWAATPYTFVEERRMCDFLEAYVAPQNFDDKKHLIPGKGSLAGAATSANVVWPGVGRVAVIRGGESYSRTLNEHFLKPFGLGGYDNWFTWNAQTMREIRSRNPDVKAISLRNAHVVPEGRPFLIAGGTIRNYEIFNWKSSEEKRIPFEITPLYAGSPSWYSTPTKHYSEPIGGGFIETFAFDTIRPARWKSGSADAYLYHRVPFRDHPTPTLGDIVGVSGAALGEIQAPVLFLGHPRFNSWSPQALEKNGHVKDQRENYQDGGHSDNLGIMPLLARRIRTIIAFVNSEEPIQAGENFHKLPDYVEALFRDDCNRAPGKTMYHNMQVFPTGQQAEIAKQVRRSVSSGGPAVARTLLTTKACRRFNVSPYEVEVYWVFLEATNPDAPNTKASHNWIKELPLKSVARERLMNGSVTDFPTYKTFFHNRDKLLWDVIDLRDEQAALLSHYTAWIVAGSESPLRRLKDK